MRYICPAKVQIVGEDLEAGTSPGHGHQSKSSVVPHKSLCAAYIFSVLGMSRGLSGSSSSPPCRRYCPAINPASCHGVLFLYIARHPATSSPTRNAAPPSPVSLSSTISRIQSNGASRRVLHPANG